jgi:hypothetical protein
MAISRFTFVTGIFVCLQMSDGRQIQQQDTISSFFFPPEHQYRVLEIFLIQAKFSVKVASLNNIPNYEFFIFTDVSSCIKVHCDQPFGPKYLLHFRCRIKFFEEIVTSKFEVELSQCFSPNAFTIRELIYTSPCLMTLAMPRLMYVAFFHFNLVCV